MKSKLALSALAACLFATGATLEAQTAGSVAGGVSASGPNGSVAGGGAASVTKQQRKRGHHNGTAANTSTATRCLPGTASTSTAGSAYTDRRTATSGITTSGTASGSGTVRSTSEGDAYASMTRDGSDADAYGNSTAVAREPTQKC